MQKEEIALVEEISRRIAREEIALALAVKVPPEAKPKPEKEPAKGKKLGGKK